jgi:hypothetical protein
MQSLDLVVNFHVNSEYPVCNDGQDLGIALIRIDTTYRLVIAWAEGGMFSTVAIPLDSRIFSKRFDPSAE